MRFAWLLVVACSAPAPKRGEPPKAPAVDPFAGVASKIEAGAVPKTSSVLVMRGAKVVYERYFNGATPETLHDTRSVGKSMTAMLVGIAIDRKLLPGVEARAFEYLSDLRPFAHAGALKDQVTLEDFLTMSSALDCDDDLEQSPGNEENMYPKPVWARWAADIPVKADYQRDAAGRGPWHYCTAGSFLLGQIVQRAAKRPVDEVMAELLFAPLGIARWEFSKSPAGEVMTGGGLRLTSRDLGKLGWLMRSAGAWQGTQVVPATWMQRALTAHRHAFPETEYGYQFWRRTYRFKCGATYRSLDAWAMSGNGGNAVLGIPELDASVVVARTNYSTGGMHQQTTNLIEDEILPALACP